MATQFYSYYGSIINLDSGKIDRIMTKETLDKSQYNYIDSTGLSFIKIGTNCLYISDPNYSICKEILTDQWQIFFDSTYAGFGNIKFVAKTDSPFDPTKWKNINQVLALYDFGGALPITSFESVYMKIVKLDSDQDPINYIPGTLFVPNQPFVHLQNYVAGTPLLFPHSVDTRIRYNTIVATADLIGADLTAQMTPIITGDDIGKVYVPITGKYLVEASFGVTLPSVTVPSPQM